MQIDKRISGDLTLSKPKSDGSHVVLYSHQDGKSVIILQREAANLWPRLKQFAETGTIEQPTNQGQ